MAYQRHEVTLRSVNDSAQRHGAYGRRVLEINPPQAFLLRKTWQPKLVWLGG